MNVASSEAVIQMINFGPEGTTNELFFIRELFILILCVRVFFFPACMYGHHMCACCSRKSIEGIRSPGTGIRLMVSLHEDMRIKPGSSERSVSNFPH